MRYALIDNSTLTGIQRLLGEIIVKNKYIVDNDILAFENYIQAILFYDEILCIDDYKEEYRYNRINYFPNIRFISKSYFNYDQFVTSANDITHDISLSIKSGKISDTDFKEYFEGLHMNFQFTWDMSSSKFFLTQKMLLGNSILNHEHFSVLHSLLFKENNEQYEVQLPLNTKKPVLFDKYGNELDVDLETGKVLNSIDGEGVSKQFQALVSSLNWISQRTAFYTLTAEYLYSDLILQPIRQSFLQNIIRRIYPSYNLGVFGSFFNSVNQMSKQSLNNILNESQNFGLAFDVPLFAAYFAKKTGNPLEIIPAALNERNNKHFVEARNKLRELNLMADDGKRKKFTKEINLLISDLNNCFSKIENKYGLGQGQGVGLSQLKFLWSWIPIVGSVSIPKELDIRIKQLEFMKDIAPRKGLNAVYRNVVEDLLEYDNIGKYKDILTSKVNFDEKAVSYGIKTEDPRYVKASSYWKKPM
ncbi:hypothetical protein [Flavobacterium sp.]|uniref:hypothetical protein n=1 Tax=Flavobacterium sp. TaxID=239 RepID=UPI002612D7CD|nr:hypothetical protein [Flavobacterium sp.]